MYTYTPFYDISPEKWDWSKFKVTIESVDGFYEIYINTHMYKIEGQITLEEMRTSTGNVSDILQSLSRKIDSISKFKKLEYTYEIPKDHKMYYRRGDLIQEPSNMVLKEIVE